VNRIELNTSKRIPIASRQAPETSTENLPYWIFSFSYFNHLWEGYYSQANKPCRSKNSTRYSTCTMFNKL